MNPDGLLTESLRSAKWGKTVVDVLAAALQAADPAEAVARSLRRSGDLLSISGQDIDLRSVRRVLVVGAGKAGAPMARAAAGVLGERLAGGLVIVKEGYAGGERQDGPVEIVEAGHPLPDERGVKAAQRLGSLLHGLGEDDLVIGLISGGGSALLASPAPGVQLADLQALTTSLLACGARIDEINILRKHLEQLKGGELARLTAPARMVNLVLSDVVGDPLDAIASGPGVPDPSTFEQAWAVLERYGILKEAPQAVIERLRKGLRGEIPETPKPGEALFRRVQNVVVGSNAQAARAGLDHARQEGLNTLLLTTYLQGEARQAGRMLGAIARQVVASGEPLPRPGCLAAGGETTVTLRGKGLGGRNQEAALGAVAELAGLRDIALVTLATDGGDGPTDAAGAVATGDTLRRALAAGMSPDDFLARNDAYHFFEALGDLLKPGPTQTNVNDLAFLFAF